jgi:molybdopterin-binding protein
MTELLRIGDVAQALGVSVDTLRRWETAGRVKFIRRGNQRLLPADELGDLLRSYRPAYETISAGNQISGVVVAVEREGVMAKVEMACGPYRVVSLMSAEAAGDLGLEPGVEAIALVESADVMIER